MGVSGEIVWSLTDDKVKVYGFLKRADRVKDIAVLFIHGSGGDIFWDELLNASEILVANGITFLALEDRGSSIIRRVYRIGHNAVIAGSAYEGMDSVKDISSAFKFLKKEGYKHIFLIGHSKGCQKVLYYNKKNRINGAYGIVLLSPDDIGEYIHSHYGIRLPLVKWYYKLVNTIIKNPEYLVTNKWLGTLSLRSIISILDERSVERRIINYNSIEFSYFFSVTVPLLVVFGGKDEFLIQHKPEYYIDRIRESSKGWVTGVKIENATHSFENKMGEVFEQITNFIESVMNG